MNSNPRREWVLDQVSPNDTVLDVGCVQYSADAAKSDTWLHRHLCDKAAEVIGIDIRKKEIEKLIDSGYDVYHMNAEEINFDRKFSLIVAGEVIEHLSNPGKFLEGARKHLKENGRLLLTTPNAQSIPHLLGALRRGTPSISSEHTAWYDENVIKHLLKRHKFKIQKLEYTRPNIIPKLMKKLGFNQYGGTSILIEAKIQLR